MSYRRPSKSSPYWVEPELFDTVVHFCRCYPMWKKELETLPDSSKAITYDSDKVQTSGGYDVTSALALKRVEIERKINLIDTAAQTVDREIWKWIVKGTTEKYTFQQLKQQGIPCERNYFSKRKSEFYYLLSKRI